MIKKFVNSIVAQIFSLGIFTLVFFHESFNMQFWKDDSELLYTLQQGIRIKFPYQHILDFYLPIFWLSGTNPFGYFLTGVLLIFISSVVFYLLVSKLFSNKIIAFLSTLLYISAPTGVDSIFMAVTFATGYFVLLLLLLMLLCMLKYYEKKKLIYYIIAILILGINIEVFPYRAFYFGGILILFEIIYSWESLITIFKKTIKSRLSFLNKAEKGFISGFILRQLFTLFVWIFVEYVMPVYFFPDTLKYVPSSSNVLYENIFNYKLVLHPLLTIINIVFGGLPYIFYKDFYFHNFSYQLILLGFMLLLVVYLFFWIRKNKPNLIKAYVLTIGSLYLTILAFYPYSQREISVASFRYMTNALPLYAIFIIFIFVFVKDVFKKYAKLKYLFVMFFISVFLINSITVQIYVKDFNTRSYYRIQYFTQLKKSIPVLPKHALIYIKLNDDENINYRLHDSQRGGIYSANAYYAITYDMKVEDINNPIMDKDYSVLLENAKKSMLSKDKIFAFTYEKDGLKDIARKFREDLNK